MTALITLIAGVAALTYAYMLGQRHTVKKLHDALRVAQLHYESFEHDPNHRVGMLRFLQILRAQLHERSI